LRLGVQTISFEEGISGIHSQANFSRIWALSYTYFDFDLLCGVTNFRKLGYASRNNLEVLFIKPHACSWKL
jgi:hypothetical protein